MEVMVNGEWRTVAEGGSVAELLAELEAPSKGIAVALDGDVVPRASWSATTVRGGARLDIMTAVQGG